MASNKDTHLYGHRPTSRSKGKEISSSNSVAFSSSLKSLIATSRSAGNKPTSGRTKPKKEDIFSTHNKGVKKRALKDLEDSDFTQKHRGRTEDEKAEDEALYRSTKRKMEEKARLYNALKRGDIEDVDEKYDVDFDTKWAETQEKGGSDSESDDESEASDEELIEYIDEFGRTRKGTRGQAAREEMRKKMLAANESNRFSARPSAAPEGIIYGDTIQTGAFNPDATIAQQMAELAAKRDKELTPPPEEHFDGSREKRQRGTGFFQFSKDEEERQQQMANLEKEREETEKARAEKAKEARQKRMDDRAKLLAERKQKIDQKRSMAKASKFLDEFGAELLGNQVE